MNLDRYIAVKLPIYTTKWCRTQQATKNSSIIVTILSLLNIHLLLFVHGDNNNNNNNKDNLNSNQSTVNPFQYQRCYLHKNYIYFFENIYTWIDMFLVTIIPFLFITLCNLTVINRVFLVSTSTKKSDLVSRSKATYRLRSLCLIMICSSFIFVATTLPVTAFLIDLLSNKSSLNEIRCRRIQWTIYNILMYFNYSSILSYCLSGTEFRHVLRRTMHLRTKSSLTSMFPTDAKNVINQRRTSTPQQSSRMIVNYEDQQCHHLLSYNVLSTMKINNNQNLLQINYRNTKYLDIQPRESLGNDKHSWTNQTNCPGLTLSLAVPSPQEIGSQSNNLTNDENQNVNENLLSAEK